MLHFNIDECDSRDAKMDEFSSLNSDMKGYILFGSCLS